jgi:hypothetical protein
VAWRRRARRGGATRPVVEVDPAHELRCRVQAAGVTSIDSCTILGTPGNDVLAGTDGNDVICGLGGDDRLDGKGCSSTTTSSTADLIVGCEFSMPSEGATLRPSSRR